MRNAERRTGPAYPPQRCGAVTGKPCAWKSRLHGLGRGRRKRTERHLVGAPLHYEALAAWLHAHGHIVSVVNPARIKGYAQATMQRNKTDKLDRAVIAFFCRTHRPKAWQPLSDEHRRLRALVRHRDDLLQTQLQQTNRLRDTTDSVVRASLEAVAEVVTK